MRENKDKVAGWVFDEAGQLRLGARTTDSGSTEILRVDKDALVKVYECNVFESCQPIRFHKDGTQAYMITNKGDVDLIGLVLLDPASGKDDTRRERPEEARRSRQRDLLRQAQAISSPRSTRTSASAGT